jgi:translation initiation factor IF-3
MDDFVPVTDKRLDIGLFSNEKSHKKKTKSKKKKPIENYNNIKLLKNIYEEDVEEDNEGQHETNKSYA